MCTPKSGMSAAPGMSGDEFAAMEKARGFGDITPLVFSVINAYSSNFGESEGTGIPIPAWDKDAATTGLQADINQWIQDNPERYKLGAEQNRLDALAQAGKPTKQAARSPAGSANPAAGGPTGGAGGHQGAQGDLSGTGAAESFQLGSAALLAQRRKSLLGA